MAISLKQNPLPAESEWLRAEPTIKDIGVDRDAKVLRGMVVAQEGVFKSRRGAFDLRGLKKIKAMMNKSRTGLKSRFTHPTLSADGLGKFLGRVKNPTLELVDIDRDGEKVPLHLIRGDLHFNPTALKPPPEGGTPRAEYIMDLAESDPGAFGSSLVLQADEEQQLDERGKPKLGTDGQPLPPIWIATKLHASDLVDEGDAVDAILSADLPDSIVQQAAKFLDAQFPDADREVVEARVKAWLTRYLDWRYGEQCNCDTTPATFTISFPAVIGKPLAAETPQPQSKEVGISRQVAELEVLLVEHSP